MKGGAYGGSILDGKECPGEMKDELGGGHVVGCGEAREGATAAPPPAA